jgi:hypothetical protein
VDLSLSEKVPHNYSTSRLINSHDYVILFSTSHVIPTNDENRTHRQTICVGDRVTIVGKPELQPGEAAGFREARGRPHFSADETALYLLHGSKRTYARAARGNRFLWLLVAGAFMLALAAGFAILSAML